MAGTYTDDYSVGNRTAAPNLITVTTALATVGNPSVLVNGAFDNAFYFNNGQTAQIVTFDFGAINASNVIITEFKWYQDTAASHGTWQFEGSNDNTSYTPIGATFTLGGVVTQTVSTMSGNITGYRYYRIRQTAGTTSNGPYLREIEFQLERLVYPTTDIRTSLVDVEYMNSTPSNLFESLVDVEFMGTGYPTNLDGSFMDVEFMGNGYPTNLDGSFMDVEFMGNGYPTNLDGSFFEIEIMVSVAQRKPGQAYLQLHRRVI